MWSTRLHWSFAPTRTRLQTALSEGTLNGFASLDREGVAAYATYALDGARGIVGSFFASARVQASGLEALLVRRVLDHLEPYRLDVIDCQTLFSSAPELKEPFQAKGFASASRRYMMLDRASWLASRRALPATRATRSVHRTHLRDLSRLIFEGHQGSSRLDASSSFDTLDSCEKILRQITIDEVCGPFDSFCSRRIEEESQTISACLVTWPHHGVFHVSEVATAPERRRQGLARQCLTETLASAFERPETKGATLSVTASNRAAIALYESLGFRSHIEYQSHVWRGGRA